MKGILLLAGRLAGIAGILLTAVAGGARLAGLHWLGSYQTGTVLLGGMALMLMACLALLAALSAGQAPDRL